MASIDGDYGLSHQLRLEASAESYRKQKRAHRAQNPARAYSKIDSGQIIRTLALIALCFGVTQLPRADKADSATAALATPVKR